MIKYGRCYNINRNNMGLCEGIKKGQSIVICVRGNFNSEREI